jgi:hypothetical protein
LGKISVYILLILIYLGLAKSFYPAEQAVKSVQGIEDFAHQIQDAPVTVILIDYFKTGFIIKTYFQKYMVVPIYRPAEALLVRTNRDFWNQNKDYLGMSVFSRYEKDQFEVNFPTPPGSIFIGESTLGQWIRQENGEKKWSFHRPYRDTLPEVLGWGEFTPDYRFYENSKLYLGQQKIFWGLNNEFGTNGTMTSKLLSHSIVRPQKQKITWVDYLMSWYTWPSPFYFGPGNITGQKD